VEEGLKSEKRINSEVSVNSPEIRGEEKECYGGKDLLPPMDGSIIIQTLTLSHNQGQISATVGNESVPIQLAQCWFSGLAIFNAKI